MWLVLVLSPAANKLCRWSSGFGFWGHRPNSRYRLTGDGCSGVGAIPGTASPVVGYEPTWKRARTDEPELSMASLDNLEPQIHADARR